MKKLLFLLLSFTATASFKSIAQAPSSIKVSQQPFVTYPFSDPDPIASQTAIIHIIGLMVLPISPLTKNGRL